VLALPFTSIARGGLRRAPRDLLEIYFDPDFTATR
jgi:hypothetical protein